MDEKLLLEQIDAFVAENRENVLRDLKTLVDINSVEGQPQPGAPFGPGPRKALEAALDIAAGAVDMQGKTILPLDFTMARNEAVREDSYRAAAAAIKAELSVGRDVAMVNLGDVLPDNVLFEFSEREREWSGEITGGYVSGDTLFADEIPQKLWPLPVGALYSVGRATASKLTASQIRTIGDLAKTDLTRVQKLVGIKMGKLIHDYANGMDSSPVLAEPEAVKGYGNSVTLEEDVTDTAQANKILLALCDSVASRMRADGRRCSCVTVTIRGNDFRNKSHQRKLPEPTDVTAEVFALSKTLFSELWDGYTPLRLLGVTLGDVSDNETVQLSMFQDDQKDRARKLDQTVDQLRSKFGVTAISRGSVTDATKRVGRKYKAQLEEDKPK